MGWGRKLLSAKKRLPPAYTSPTQQSKIERWHRSLKNLILLENYYLPGELKAALHKFVDYYNHERYHESLKNLAGQMCFMTVARKY